MSKHSQKSPSSKNHQCSNRLELEALEDRTLPAVSTGTVTGLTFFDLNSNGTQEANETPIAGVSMFLKGTTNQGTAINVEVLTNAAGQFSFQNVLPGTYQVIPNPDNGLISGGAGIGNLSYTRRRGD